MLLQTTKQTACTGQQVNLASGARHVKADYTCIKVQTAKRDVYRPRSKLQQKLATGIQSFRCIKIAPTNIHTYIYIDFLN